MATVYGQSTHLGLDHVRAVQAQVEHGTVDVQRVLGVQLLQNPVQDNEGSGASHASTGSGEVGGGASRQSFTHPVVIQWAGIGRVCFSTCSEPQWARFRGSC